MGNETDEGSTKAFIGRFQRAQTNSQSFSLQPIEVPHAH
jgi:hypothetical protein